MPGGIHPPIEVILAWPKPNYINPETRPDTVLVLACVLGPITLAMLLARLWVRIMIQKQPGWDDWIMMAATVPIIALTVLYPFAVNLGFNRHIWDIDLINQNGRLVTTRKHLLVGECIFCVASGMIKIAILLFYRRLSSRAVSTTFRRVTWIGVGFIAASTIALTLAPILGCQPISAFWEQIRIANVLGEYKFHCFDEGADVFAASIISASQDLLTAVLPTFLYWNLQIPIRQKIALFGIFAIGYAGVAIGAVRAFYSWRVFYDTYDVTWWTWDLMLTCLLELHIGAFCANAPAMKVFFKHFFAEKRNISPYHRTTGPLNGLRHKPRVNPRSQTTSSSLLSKFSSFLSKTSQSHNSNGYISEQHTDLSVDAHGGVQVQCAFEVTRSSRSTAYSARHESATTADLAYDHYYEDIELGRYTTGHNSRASSPRSTRVIEEMDLDALPPMPKTPLSPVSVKEFFSYGVRWHDPKLEPLPRIPTPALFQNSSRNFGRAKTISVREGTNKKPKWQSWS